MITDDMLPRQSLVPLTPHRVRTYRSYVRAIDRDTRKNTKTSTCLMYDYVRFLSKDLDFKPRYGECRFLLREWGSVVEMFRLQINRYMLSRRRRSICHWSSLWLSICSSSCDEETEKPVLVAAAAAVEHSLSPLRESYYVNYSLIDLALALV